MVCINMVFLIIGVISVTFKVLKYYFTCTLTLIQYLPRYAIFCRSLYSLLIQDECGFESLDEAVRIEAGIIWQILDPSLLV